MINKSMKIPNHPINHPVVEIRGTRILPNHRISSHHTVFVGHHGYSDYACTDGKNVVSPRSSRARYLLPETIKMFAYPVFEFLF